MSHEGFLLQGASSRYRQQQSFEEKKISSKKIYSLGRCPRGCLNSPIDYKKPYR